MSFAFTFIFFCIFSCLSDDDGKWEGISSSLFNSENEDFSFDDSFQEEWGRSEESVLETKINFHLHTINFNLISSYLCAHVLNIIIQSHLLHSYTLIIIIIIIMLLTILWTMQLRMMMWWPLLTSSLLFLILFIYTKNLHKMNTWIFHINLLKCCLSVFLSPSLNCYAAQQQHIPHTFVSAWVDFYFYCSQ